MAKSWNLEYLGGIPEIKKACPCKILPGRDYIVVKPDGAFAKQAFIKLSEIVNASIKTEEQISKDVTMTRLLALGVFAFAAKKKRKEITYYVVIEYGTNGINQTAMFTGADCNSFFTALQSARQNYLQAHPVSEPAATEESFPISTAPALDTAAEIEKYHDLWQRGIITEDDFNAKKAQLLEL